MDAVPGLPRRPGGRDPARLADRGNQRARARRQRGAIRCLPADAARASAGTPPAPAVL